MGNREHAALTAVMVVMYVMYGALACIGLVSLAYNVDTYPVHGGAGIAYELRNGGNIGAAYHVRELGPGTLRIDMVDGDLSIQVGRLDVEVFTGAN